MAADLNRASAGDGGNGGGGNTGARNTGARNTGGGDGGQRPEHVFLVGLAHLPFPIAATKPVLRRVGYSALTSALLYLFRPDHVVCPLVAETFDALQMVARLRLIGFGGRLTVIADVPDPAMVQAELEALAPNIDIRVMRW